MWLGYAKLSRELVQSDEYAKSDATFTIDATTRQVFPIKGVQHMSENLIESVEPLLAPPVTRRPGGISARSDAGASTSVLVLAYDDGAEAAATIVLAYDDGAEAAATIMLAAYDDGVDD
jgi:hypothetical protein